MTVKFHPENSLDALEQIIIKSDGSPLRGEIDIYRKLHYDLSKSNLHWDVWHDLKLPKHSDNANYYNKTSAQVDFLIVCELGLLVLEVKGGAISLKDSTFYFGRNFETQMKQNPFRQAEGYKFTLKDSVLNNFKDCCFCDAVAFPHVDYRFEAKIFDVSTLWTPYNAINYEDSIEIFILKVFETTKANHLKYRKFRNISSKERESITRILSPIIGDKSGISSINTLEWLGVQNTELLDGLSKNPRIMIEGPPGCGKTTIAKAFIDRQANKKGIYLCWNNLLMYYTRDFLNQRNLASNVEVTTYFQFFKKLNQDIDYDNLSKYSEVEFTNLVRDTIDRLEKEGRLATYDFIVIDEAQDLFDRGLDLFLDRFASTNGAGLSNGNFLILYDIDQSYVNNGRNVAEYADFMSYYCAHFKLNENKRSSQSPQIRELSLKILDDEFSLSEFSNKSNENQPIIVNYFRNLKDVKRHLVKTVLTSLRETSSSLKGQDCVILVESSLFNEIQNNGEHFRELMTIKDVQEISKDNIADACNILKYTTILKFKGLEKKNVFLIVKSPSILNQYELYVGITRAILNLEVIIVEA